MDERHWWIATKLQQTFHIEGNDNPTLLEEFFLQAENLELVDAFLAAEGLSKLFFYTNPNSQEVLRLCDLKIGDSLEDIDPKQTHILYFLRQKSDRDVDPVHMEQDIFCGEMRGGLVKSLRSQLSELYIPLLRAQRSWGYCTSPHVTHFLAELEKYVTSLQDFTTSIKQDKQQILKRPVNTVSTDIMHRKSAAFDSDMISANEALVSDWMKTIEQILNEGSDDRVLDVNTSPLTELERWRRRQRTLESITEQLRGKECKTVIGFLISTKSRLLKKWKTIDISITDVSNETKSRVKYLEALQRHFDALSNESSPINLMGAVLPAIINGIKQMDSLSRSFSRNGYLGLLLTKVCNQLTMACRDFLEKSVVSEGSEDNLWDRIKEEMGRAGVIDLHSGLHHKNKGKENNPEQLLNTNTFYEKIQGCLALQAYFLEAVRGLREALGGSHGLHRFSSSSSLSTMQGKVTSFSTGRATKASIRVTSVTSSCDHSHDCQGPGVSLTDEETIMHNMDTLCCKLRQFANVILTLQQYKILSEQTKGLQKPSCEDLFINEPGDREGGFDPTEDTQRKEEHLVVDTLKRDIIPCEGEPYHSGMVQRPLQTLLEEDEVQSGTGLLLERHQLHSLKSTQQEGSSPSEQKVEVEEEEENEDVLTEEEKTMLRNLYNWEDPDEEGQCLSDVLSDCISNMFHTMASAVRIKLLLNVEKRDTERFEDAYSEFLVMNQQLERYLSIYLQALFLRKMNTAGALSVLNRFSVVSSHQGVQPMINECYIEALDWFYEDLKEIQETYEKYKDDPVLPKNMPPAAGAIYWSRKLFSRIEEPMKVFKEIRVIASSNTYTQAVKLYNRIAATLVGFENLWYQKWRSEVDGCVSGLNATLLVRNPTTQELMVNCDQRVIQLFEETKWMMQFKLNVPQAAILSLKQERKYKTYKSHLEGLLQEYQCVKKTIPKCLAVLFAAQLEGVSHHFQPGLSVLNWLSIDIEAFLHNVYTDITRLRIMVEKISKMKDTIIDKALADIQRLVLFNTDEVLSEPLSPAEFLQLTTLSLRMKQEELNKKVETIRTAISDIRASLKVIKDPPLAVTQRSTLVKTSHRRSHSRLWPTLSKSSQDAPISLSSPGNDCAQDSESQVLEYFRGQTCSAVLGCVCRSLLILAQVSGCDIERLIKGLPCHHKEDPPDPCSACVLFATVSENLSDPAFQKPLRLTLKLRLTIPTIVTDPPVESALHALMEAASAMLNVTDYLQWDHEQNVKEPLPVNIKGEETIQCILSLIRSAINDLQPSIEKHIFQYRYYEFLWRDDMNSQYTELTSANPELFVINKEVDRLEKIEQKILDIPLVFQTGCLWLDTSLIKDALKGFAGVWKCRYASVLHQDIKKRLDEAIEYNNASHKQLLVEVKSLEELNISLCLLEDLLDMENKIDGMYLPIESVYQQLRSYNLRLPREEITEVTNLRSSWADLMALADSVKIHLLKDRKTMFEQELDKQVKSFAVDVIQLRNSFDTQGPAAPNMSPEEAVNQLHIFQEKFQLYDAKRKTLNSLQRLFSITPKAFPELDRTEKDLLELGTLYELFQKFLSFNQRFRDTLWAEVDLKQNDEEAMDYWIQCQNTKDKLKDWDPYNEMAAQIQFYSDCFPVLHRLAAKEIRNRHWLQVMAVTGSSFPLEATVFRLHHLLDIELIKHQTDIISIATAAREELQLEIKMRSIEEEWSEQLLSFELHKSLGPVLLGKEETLLTLEQLEDARLLLAQMLMSRHIGPLREEAAAWADKLKDVAAILDLWVEVQDLWQNLQPVFSDTKISKELYQEAKRFAKVERNWIKLMRSAYRTKNVLQCCCNEEVPKEVILHRMHKELEVCCQFLTSFLDMKRQAFPRFYFLPDLVLLSFLSHSTDIALLHNLFGLIFSGVADVLWESSDAWEDSSGVSELSDAVLPAGATEALGSVSHRSAGTHLTDTDSLFPKSLRSAGLSLESPVPLSTREPAKEMQAMSVMSGDGECLVLDEQVHITTAMEEWLSDLQSSVHRSLESRLDKAILDTNQGVSIDEWTHRHPFQIARMNLLYGWTRDCEAAISDLKSDPKALLGAVKKHSGMISRLSSVITNGSWKHCDQRITPSQKLKLENLVMFAVYLRDVLEYLSARKVLERTDFEWRRAIRFYCEDNGNFNRHILCIHDAQYECGYEFYGATAPVIMTPTTEKSFLALSYIRQKVGGAAVLGDHGAGKTQTLKGFAHLLGKFLLIFHCSYYSNPLAITAILQGTAMDGCWVCFDDFHLLSKPAVSALMINAQTLYNSLKATLNTCILGDGKKITLNRDTGLFLTVHCKSGYAKLPEDVLVLFRTVSLSAPDHSMILRGNLTALGFKSPKMLTHQLQLVTQLVQEQLSETLHHHFSLSTLVSVVQRAAQKKEAERWRRREGRQDHTEGGVEGGRTSQSSSITSTLPVTTSAMSLSPSLKTDQSFDRKARTMSTSAARRDRVLVGETLHEYLSPRMKGDDLIVFDQIVKDIFGGQLDVSLSKGDAESEITLVNAISTAAKNISLVPHAPWVDKVKQLYHLSRIHHGIIVAGPPGAGKSSCISALIQALSLLPSDQTVQSEGTLGKEHKERLSHKLVKFNPQAVDDFTLLFGSHAPSHIWTDSIITSTWRKAIRHSGNTWLCFDGTLTPAWVDNFNSVLEANKMLQLNNGEHLPLTSSIRLLFETSSLELASPAFISRVGMLYLDNNITGWRPLAETWLAQRNELENHVLSRAFNNTLDPIFNFVLHDIKGPIPLTEVGLFQTTTSLLQAMLNDKAQSLGGPLHIERLFLFCLIWIAGGLIKGPEKKKFSDILKTHTSNLPDYDDEVSVFDFYVDESGEWDPWQSRMSQQSSDRPANGLGEVFVETIDTLAVRTLMDYADMASQNVLLVGSAGCGKTALVNDFFNTQDKPNVLMKRIIFSGSSKAKTLQQLLEQSIVHREGFIFGAKEGKTLQMFIDDVNLPENECCSELLRQVLDDKVLLKLTKPFERRQIEGLVVQATMSLSPHLKANAISQRLLRHFAVLYLPAPEGSRLRHIIFTTLQENMAKNDVQQLEKHLHSALVSTSCSLLESIKTTLRPSDVWGRQHYLFSLREMIRAFECLSILTDRQRKDADLVLSLWQHEIRHIVGDRLCRHADLNWFQQQLRNTIEQNFPNSHSKDLNHCYVTFPLDETVTRQFGDTPEKGVKVQLQQVKGLQEVKSCLQAYVHQYNKQLGSDALDIQLSENTVAHVVRVHRVLAYRHSGNLVVVGSPGSHLRTLLKLALSVSRIPVIPMDASQPAHFYSSLKSAVRLAASEGRTAAVVLTARELKDDSYLDAVNSILISGDYTPLFSPGETRDLLQVLNPTLQQNPTLTRDPVQYLASTVKANLHVIVCLPPNHSLLRTSSVKYPGFLSGCHMIWLCDWTPEAILHEAEHYTSECNVIGNLSEETRMQVASVMASIHHQILANCEQVPWAGYWGPALTLNTFTVQKTEKDGKETVKAESMTVSNLPYSAAIVKERIGVLLKKEHKLAYNKVFCGNATFKNYLQTFRHIYSLKFTEQEKMGSLLRKGLSTLDQSHSDVQNTQDLIKDLACQYGDAQSAASELLDRLSTRASSLERLKAQLGIGAKSLTVFLSQEEDESEETELEDLLKDDEFDRYDEAFFQMKERTCTSHSNKLKENLETAKRVMEEARDSLAHAKNQVMHWCNKVDKSCIERISRCQNPPFLLAQVMEMVIVMLNLMPRPNDPDLDTPRPAKPSGQNPERGQFQKSSGTYLATRPTKRGPNRGYGKGGKDKVDKSWWKALQNYVGDSTKFVDMIQNVACQDEGLAPDALERVEAYLGKTKGGTLGVTGEGSLLENAAPHLFFICSPFNPCLSLAQTMTKPTSKKDATPRSITTARKFSLAETSGQRGGITIAAARYSSEEAATLVALVVALVEYTRLCGPLRSELRLVHELEKHKEEQERKDRETQKLVDAEEEDLKEAEPKKPELTAEDLPTLQSEVLQLQAEYDTAVMKKHRLEIDLQSHKERLKSAQDVLKRLRPLETQWKDTLELIDASGLITNCLIASAFLIYCGPFHSEGRHLASELFIQKCQEGGLSPPRKLLFRDMTLKDFLHNPRELKRFETKGPALNKNTAIVSCAFKYDGCNGTWVLLCDPMAQSIEWIKNHFIVSCKEVPYHELQSQLDSCLTEGVPLLLTYCDLQALAADQRFAAVLRSRLQFGRSGSPFKITVGDHQVECQPGFRLVLHTTGVPEEVPAEIAAFCTTLYFYQDQEGLSEQLLDSFVLLEKIRLGTEYSTLQKACLENMEDLQMVEEKILQCLSGECTLLQSLAINRSLSDLKKHYDEALAKKFKLAELEKSTLAAREGFRLIADRAALMFNLSNTMRQVNPVYHISFDQLLEVFSAAIVHSERYSIKTLVERITYNLFCYIGKYIMERDQMVYTLLLALEIESCLGHVTPGMIEFLICPDLCVAVMEAMQAKPSEARQHAKNPFEWMTEEQFKNVQILATYYSWFHNLFDRMYKDGKDMSWKSLCDSDQPENTAKAKGPEGLGGLGPLQRLLVIRAIRSDRLTQAASLYISSVLGKKYVTEIPSDLQACLQLTKPQTPILLLYSSEADEPRRQILELSARRGCETQVVSVNGGSISEERRIRYLIEESQAKGRWLLLENIHNSQPLMTSVECLLLANKSPDRHFRLWISAQVISNVPVQLLHASLRIITDTPKNMKDAMVRCMQQVCSDTLHSSGRPEWPALIHNLCYVHCAVRLRASSGGPTGWNCRDAMMFGIQDFRDALQVLTEEFRDRSAEAEGRSISWTGIRYLLSEVIYGKNIIDDCDKKSLASLFDLWISSTATKKDYDMTKLRYRIPAAFFDPDLQLNNLLQALDCIPRHALDVPEGVSMHSTPELHFGDEKYVYSWLQTLYDSFLFHQQQHSLAIQKHHRNFLIKSNKDQEVWEICYNILAKLPKGWSKDFINERLKKIGGNTLFNMFMRKELNHLMEVLSEVKRNLQAIRNSTECLLTLGDSLTVTELSVARDLSQQRVPSHWSSLAGMGSPPELWTAATWIRDLQQRTSHFEKILQLGQEKMPTYWLSAFKNPRGLLGVFRQQSVRKHAEQSSFTEPMEFHTMITQRDKDHMRDPPQEGMFVYGIHVWGVSWHKTEAELLDAPPRHGPVCLPVIHLQCLPRSEKASLTESMRSFDSYQCPVYSSFTGAREPVLHLDIHKDNIPASRWALRGMKATLQPF